MVTSNIVKEVHLQIPEAQDSKQDKPKENHTQIHYNQTAKYQRKRKT